MKTNKATIEKAISDKNNQLSSLNQSVKKKNEKMATLDQKIQQKTTESTSIDKMILDKKAWINDLQRQINMKHSEYTIICQEVSNQKRIINDLQDKKIESRNLENEIKKKQEILDNLNQEIEKKKKQYNDMMFHPKHDEVSQLNSEIVQKKKKLRGLEDELADLYKEVDQYRERARILKRACEGDESNEIYRRDFEISQLKDLLNESETIIKYLKKELVRYKQNEDLEELYRKINEFTSKHQELETNYDINQNIIDEEEEDSVAEQYKYVMRNDISLEGLA